LSVVGLAAILTRRAAKQAFRRGSASPVSVLRARALPVDAGGYIVGFAPGNHKDSSFVELTVIGRDLKCNY
jgi:hypothetical protein